jgi:hypothetical protein
VVLDGRVLDCRVDGMPQTYYSRRIHALTNPVNLLW